MESFLVNCDSESTVIFIINSNDSTLKWTSLQYIQQIHHKNFFVKHVIVIINHVKHELILKKEKSIYLNNSTLGFMKHF